MRVEGLPGPCAALTALSGSGLPSERFVFLGFLPRNGGHPAVPAVAPAREVRTLIIYESPERVASTLRTLSPCWAASARRVLARELTKLYEEYVQKARWPSLLSGIATEVCRVRSRCSWAAQHPRIRIPRLRERACHGGADAGEHRGQHLRTPAGKARDRTSRLRWR